MQSETSGTAGSMQRCVPFATVRVDMDLRGRSKGVGAGRLFIRYE